MIHGNPFIWDYYIKDFATSFVQQNAFFFVLYTVASVACIYVLCSGIDFIRIKIFQLLRISSLSEKIEALVNSFLKIRQGS